MTDSRQFVPELTVRSRPREGGGLSLLAPSPGLWRGAPARGALVRPGDVVGVLEVLGVCHRLRAPEGAVGVVIEVDARLARRPVGYGEVLLGLDPEALGTDLSADVGLGGPESASLLDADGTLVFVAPTSGRFYLRPAPDKPAFVSLGQIVERGQTLGLLEVMKTFTRINYDDPQLPAPAKVVAILAEDQADLGRGDPILRLEPVS